MVHPLLAGGGRRSAGDDGAVGVVLAGEVEDPAPVLEQHSDRDARVEPQPGQVAVRGGVELDLSFADELQRERGGEGLGVAADPGVSVDRGRGVVADLADASATCPVAVLIVHADGESRDA